MTESEQKIIDIPLSKLFADPSFNCRGVVAPIDVIDLAKNIAEVGVLQPLIVHTYNDRFRIISGHCRHMALIVNGATTAPCIIRDDLSDMDQFKLNLIENIQRKDLNILQEAKGLVPFIKARYNLKELAHELGKSIVWVDIRKKLLDLPEDIQNEAAAGMLTQEQIKVVCALPSNKKHDFVKTIKEAKQRGNKIKLPSRKPVSVLAKKERKGYEINEMIDTFDKIVGMGLHTRALAWAAGNISTYELQQDLKEYCDKEGINYTIPQEILSKVG